MYYTMRIRWLYMYTYCSVSCQQSSYIHLLSLKFRQSSVNVVPPPLVSLARLRANNTLVCFKNNKCRFGNFGWFFNLI